MPAIQPYAVYIFAFILLLLNAAAWGSNIFMLPGNWIIVVLASAYVYFLPAQYDPRVSWGIVIVIIVLAIAGEIIEFLAGAMGTRKKGGSRKSALLSILGGFVGSILGAMAGIPIPILGNLIGAVGGGAIGAFAGAYIGESGRLEHERIEIGKDALKGRLLGTAGKLAVGAVMLVVITVDSFL